MGKVVEVAGKITEKEERKITSKPQGFLPGILPLGGWPGGCLGGHQGTPFSPSCGPSWLSSALGQEREKRHHTPKSHPPYTSPPPPDTHTPGIMLRRALLELAFHFRMKRRKAYAQISQLSCNVSLTGLFLAFADTITHTQN